MPSLSPSFTGYNLATAVKSVFRKYARFSGRATLSEFWYWTLGQTVIFILLWMLSLAFMLNLFIFNDPQQMPPSRVFNHVLAGESPVRYGRSSRCSLLWPWDADACMIPIKAARFFC